MDMRELDFYINELSDLKQQYKETPKQHLKAKLDLMSLILELEKHLQRNNEDKY